MGPRLDLCNYEAVVVMLMWSSLYDNIHVESIQLHTPRSETVICCRWTTIVRLLTAENITRTLVEQQHNTYYKLNESFLSEKNLKAQVH
jgi:hypothetical protein